MKLSEYDEDRAKRDPCVGGVEVCRGVSWGDGEVWGGRGARGEQPRARVGAAAAHIQSPGSRYLAGPHDGQPIGDGEQGLPLGHSGGRAGQRAGARGHGLAVALADNHHTELGPLAVLHGLRFRRETISRVSGLRADHGAAAGGRVVPLPALLAASSSLSLLLSPRSSVSSITGKDYKFLFREWVNRYVIELKLDK